MYYYKAGYGSEHWAALARDYMTNYEDEYYIEMVGSTNSVDMRDDIINNDMDADIVQLSVDMFGQSSSLEDLTSLYEMTALGEEESGVAIKDKNRDAYDYYAEKVGGQTKYFRMQSGGNTGGYTFAYNKTTLDGMFGKGAYELPRTTKEFFAFGDDMIDKGGYLFSTALGDTSGDYTTYLTQLWFAQLMGAEDYYHYMSGEYYNTKSSAWEFAWDGPHMIRDSEKELKDTYEALQELFIKDSYYLYPYSDSLDHLSNNKLFSGAGFSVYPQKTGFMYIGSWLENEMKGVKGAKKGQTYGAIRTPVVSTLVEYLEYRDGSNYMSDEMLSSIIKAIDEGKDYVATKTAANCANLSENDFNRIYEARKMIVTVKCSDIVVPKLSSSEQGKKEQIFKFLRYLASDKAQIVAANAKGGLNMLAYGKPAEQKDLSVKRTQYVQTMCDIGADGIVIDTAHANSYVKKDLPITTLYVPGGEYLGVYFMKNTKSTAQSSQAMFNELYKAAKNEWSSCIEKYKANTGIV